ncbi:protein YgfX [Chitinibacteraceae bacterium HSL-7]
MSRHAPLPVECTFRPSVWAQRCGWGATALLMGMAGVTGAYWGLLAIYLVWPRRGLTGTLIWRGGYWQLDGEAIEILGNTRLISGWIVLRYRDGQGRSRRMTLWPDSVSSEEARQLRIALRWGSSLR